MRGPFGLVAAYASAAFDVGFDLATAEYAYPDHSLRLAVVDCEAAESFEADQQTFRPVNGKSAVRDKLDHGQTVMVEGVFPLPAVVLAEVDRR